MSSGGASTSSAAAAAAKTAAAAECSPFNPLINEVINTWCERKLRGHTLTLEI